MTSLWLPSSAMTDPAGLSKAPKAPDMFDHRPERNRGMPGIPYELRDPNDNKLIATAVGLGMPRAFAEQARTHPPARFALLKVWCDVLDAAEGDREAKERLDYYRWAWQHHEQIGEELSATGV